MCWCCWPAIAGPNVLAALECAVRDGAYSHAAVERILAAQAQPKSALEALAEEARTDWPALLRDNPVSPRPTSDYQSLCTDEPTDASSSPPTKPTDPPAEPGQDPRSDSEPA